MAPLVIPDGVTWGGLAVDSIKGTKDRDTCLAQVAAWIESEKQADISSGS